MKIVVGDIHGRIDLLDKLIEKIMVEEKMSSEAIKQNLVLTGDLFDRGNEDISTIIEYILSNDFKSVYGNHDYFLKNTYNYDSSELPIFQNKDIVKAVWSNPKNGGLEVEAYLTALRDGNIKNPRYSFEDVINYVDNLPLYKVYEEEQVIVTHSWFPDLLHYVLMNNGLKVEDILKRIPKGWYIWSNEAIQQYIKDGIPRGTDHEIIKNYSCVLGHFVVEKPYVNNSFQTFCVDTGAYRTGKLSAVIFYGNKIFRFVEVSI